MLIAGCSHTAGSELDGNEDSLYNRQHSFGGQLAFKYGYKPVNIAQNGGTNSSIARSVLNWCNQFYDKDKMKLFVLICWTESTRIEAPSKEIFWYEGSSTCVDWFDATSKHFHRINLGYNGYTEEEKELYPYFHKFIARNGTLMEIFSANYVLQMQYFLRSINTDYVMCNSMHMFTTPNIHLEMYTDLIDKSRYMDWDNNDLAFFWKYKNLGYVNEKAKYWHHGEIPHKMHSEDLYDFIERNKCLSSD